MNKKQRLVLSIFIPIIAFFIDLMIANSVGVTVTFHLGDISVVEDKYKFPEKFFPYFGVSYHTYIYDSFDWQKTWYVWVLYLIFCCIFEYKLFEDKKRITNKKNKELI